MIIEFNVEYPVFTIIAEEAKKAKRTISDEVIELIRETISQDGFKPFDTVININTSIEATITVIVKEIDMLETLVEHSNVIGLSLSNYMANLTKFITNRICNQRIDNNHHINTDCFVNPRFVNSDHSTKFVSPIDLNAYDFNAQQGFDKTATKDLDTISSIILDVFKQQCSYSIKLSSVSKLPNDIVLRTNDEASFNEYKNDVTNWYMLLATFIARLVNSDIEQYNSLKDKVIKHKDLMYYEFTISLSGICSPLEYLRNKQYKNMWRVTKSKGSLTKWRLYLVYNDKEDKVNIYFPSIIRINNED